MGNTRLLCVIEQNKRDEYPATGKIQPFEICRYVGEDLGLADSEHFRATRWACTLGCRLAVLHGDAFSILYFLLGLALNTISLHLSPPL